MSLKAENESVTEFDTRGYTLCPNVSMSSDASLRDVTVSRFVPSLHISVALKVTNPVA